MTHEYTIATGGHVRTMAVEAAPPVTAIAWAGGVILAVGDDERVRAISRGDSTFLDLGGALVTALPDDPALPEAASAAGGVGVGDPADLAIWTDAPEPRLLATVRGGHFLAPDPLRGPFPVPP